MGYITEMLLLLLGLLIGAGLGGVAARYWLERQSGRVKDRAQEMLGEARREAETIKKEAILQAKDSLFQMKADFERETKEARKEFQNVEKRILQKEENLDKKADSREASRLPNDYSTVTLFARFLGWSTSVPRNTAIW